MEIKKLIELSKNSSFKKDEGSGVTIRITDLDKFMSALMLYTDYNRVDEKISITDFFEKSVPGFQRSNDKWSQKMKIRFMENVLNGFKTDIKLFAFQDYEDYQIIDGLQRLTTIFEFLNNEFSVFGTFYFKDLSSSISQFDPKIIVKQMLFNDWREVGNFYIDMNEYITHSPEDINKAKEWFRTIQNIEL